jgi:hypothetical protein
MKSKVDNVYAMSSDRNRNEVLDWLVTTDPSPNHNNACHLHEPETGTWLIDSEEYRDWKDGGTRFLWLNGIPGAGKTVLFSYICGDIKQLCRPPATQVTAVGWAYYYCYFRRAQDETSHILRWAISQLCRQVKNVPVEVYQLFEDGVQPSITQLKTALYAVTRLFSKIYLLIDALDESSERHNLLDFLADTVEDPLQQHIQILAMSRDELDIRLALKNITVEISLSNALVDNDIRLFLQQQLQTVAFRAWRSKH